jgi:hypothetical protein
VFSGASPFTVMIIAELDGTLILIMLLVGWTDVPSARDWQSTRVKSETRHREEKHR